jgi:hypothetical protein
MNNNSEEVIQGLLDLNEDQMKRQKILSELEEEMKKLRSKYMLKHKENQVGEVKSDKGEVNIVQDQEKENIGEDRKFNNFNKISVVNDINDNKHINDFADLRLEEEFKDSARIEIDKENINVKPKIVLIPDENNFKSINDNFMLSFNFESRENQQVDNFPPNLTQTQFYSQLNNNKNYNLENKFDAFDKAKEKLLQIKNELDDMDKYDFRSVKFAKTKIETEM